MALLPNLTVVVVAVNWARDEFDNGVTWLRILKEIKRLTQHVIARVSLAQNSRIRLPYQSLQAAAQFLRVGSKAAGENNFLRVDTIRQRDSFRYRVDRLEPLDELRGLLQQQFVNRPDQDEQSDLANRLDPGDGKRPMVQGRFKISYVKTPRQSSVSSHRQSALARLRDTINRCRHQKQKNK